MDREFADPRRRLDGQPKRGEKQPYTPDTKRRLPNVAEGVPAPTPARADELRPLRVAALAGTAVRRAQTAA
jgi:hypothetical protein